MTTVFHVSDLHFGHPAVPEQYEAMETLIKERRFTSPERGLYQLKR